MLDRLFCYGTLCLPEIMCQIVGRQVPAVKASLLNYDCYALRNRHYPAVMHASGANTAGLLYSGLSARELALLDRYEGIEYRRLRVGVTLGDHKQAQAWVYVLRPQYVSRLSAERWNLEEFIRAQAKSYMKALAASGNSGTLSHN
jgi:gamma-glutamylcyclotransferase (GGCT)/AIG2-like uncharacterized protein YtfP